MIETLATVVAWKNGIVTVEASQTSSCDACSQPECGSGQVNKALARRYHKISLPHPEPLESGSQVLIAIPEQGLMTAVGLMFVLPLLCLLAGAGIGEWLFVELLGQHEVWVMLFSLLGGGAGFWGARRWHRKLAGEQSLEPKVVRVFPCLDRIAVEERTR